MNYQNSARTRIGTDVDEVMAELLDGLLDYLKRIEPGKFGALKRSDFTRYSLSHAMRWPHGTDQAYLSEFTRSPEYQKIAPVEGSVDALRHLARKGFEPHAVTLRRRHPHIVESTQEWVHRHYDGAINGRVHIIGAAEGPIGSKAAHCRELGLSIVVEDQVEHASDIAAQGTPVALMNKPWNQDFEDTEMIRRVASWDEAVKLVEARRM